jgi:hypothetical protein
MLRSKLIFEFEGNRLMPDEPFGCKNTLSIVEKLTDNLLRPR